jgi:DNA-binding XRE family transcriptional regulator
MEWKDMLDGRFAGIGKKISTARRSRAEKIDTVAKAVGLNNSVISQIENGHYYPLKMETLMKICHYLQIPVEDLFKEES